MMELENQVCSLELAKKLKELGVKQESLFYWFPFGEGIREWQVTKRILDKDAIKGWKYHEKHNKEFSFYSAFTVAELGEMLPAENENKYRFDLVKRTPNKWEMNIFDKCGIYIETFTAKTEANARAKMLIWLIEQGKVKP